MSINRDQLLYRKCVGIMVINNDNHILVGKRIDSKYDAWQMPQGGIDEGETAKDAAFRELKEEIGTNNVEIIAESEHWHNYDIPDDLIPKFWNGKYRGQTQKWYLVKFLGEDSEINIETEEPEFCEWKWAEPLTLPIIIVPFKREIYKTIVNEFTQYLT